MTVFVCTFVDQTFDKKSAEVAYIASVLDKVKQSLQASQGANASAVNVLGPSAAGASNTTLATYTYTASASNP